MRTSFIAAGLILAIAGLALPAIAQTSAPAATPANAQFQRDRASILAMAGDYKVRFDFRETVAFVPGYEPIDDKVSGGYESVRVVEDTPERIILQHLLVAEHDGEHFVIKHWRQDWVYQPAAVLTYQDSGVWTLAPVPDAQRKGAWSQTVWQTDDSPRYGGVGRWEYEGGVARWMSDETARPLARRDAVRKPVYDRYFGTNRHAITPTGWVHEQDNAKSGLKDGKRVTFVHEVVLNTYERSASYKVEAADDYWNKTRDYWAEVRKTWDQAIAQGGGVKVAEEAENGSVTGPSLMGLADQIAEGKTTTAQAVAQAKAVIGGDNRLAAR
jgi:hypothetical protein